jgi:tRNA A-37 threonylcarbamoyl transferase component Bud32
VFFKHARYPRPWSAASRTNFTADDWRRAWPELLRRVQAGQLEIIKRSRSGDVLSGEIVLGGRPVSVVIKRPRRRYWYRYLNEIGRGARARRAWVKAWKMIARNVPGAWPLLLMERRRFGYVVDTMIVFERVPGPTLAKADLDAMAPPRRDMLFRRVGRILRKIESFGFSHFDAKASNWIVMPDEKRGETPVLIDLDGIRQRRWVALGIQRLLKSLRSHPQYTPADSLALCQGYAPFTRIEQEASGVGGEGWSGEGEQTQDAPPLPSTPHAPPATSPPPGAP